MATLARLPVPGILIRHPVPMAVEDIPVPQALELRDELARWEWLPKAWKELPAESRRNYDDWVRGSSSPRSARRRAKAVARRCYTRRPWAGRPKRMLQAVTDRLTQAPETGPHEPTPGG